MGVIDVQITAYDAKDLDAFIVTYSPEAIIEDGEGNLRANGQAEIREKFSAIIAATPGFTVELRTASKLANMRY